MALRHRFIVADLNRIGGIEALHSVIPHKHGRNAVIRGRDVEELMETDLERAGLELTIVIGLGFTEAEVPFDERGAIACIFRKLGAVAMVVGMSSGASPFETPLFKPTHISATNTAR